VQVFTSAEASVHVDADMVAIARLLDGGAGVTLDDDGLGGALKDLTAFFGCAAWTQWGRRRKLEALMRYVRRDDELLREQGVGRCSAEELVEGCSQRGLRVVNMTRAELLAQLEEWHAAAGILGPGAKDIDRDAGALCALAVLMFYRCVAC
jgi:hypothetical protein